jgi:nicotinamidase-related amidase
MTETGTIGVYRAAGFGHSVRRGSRPAIVVVDFSYGFTDAAYPTGADMSSAIAATSKLLVAAHARACPIAFTTISYDEVEARTLPWLRKAPGMAALLSGSRLVEIDERLERRPDEPLIKKLGASAFFGTALATLLAAWRTDTVLIVGATTSGCVRASVVDAVQHGYDVLVPEDCVADRAVGPHEANLFDIAQKYADVITLAGAISYLNTVTASPMRTLHDR